GGVGQHTVVAGRPRRLGQRRAELRCVVGRAAADGRTHEQVAVGVADDGEFGPQPAAVAAGGGRGEGGGGVPALQAGGVHGGRGLGGDQAAVGGAQGGAHEEGGEPLFLRSRPAA